MEDHCLPKTVRCGVLSSGYHNIKAPKKQYNDYLKKFLTACHVDHHQWSTLGLETHHPCTRLSPPPKIPAGTNLVDKRTRRKNREVPASNHD